MLTQDEHDLKMKELATRMAPVLDLLDGENLFDVACVCALMATFSIHEGFRDSPNRREALEKTFEFMRKQLERMNQFDREEN